MSRFLTLLHACIFLINTYIFTCIYRIYFTLLDITLPTVKKSLGGIFKIRVLKNSARMFNTIITPLFITVIL